MSRYDQEAKPPQRDGYEDVRDMKAAALKYNSDDNAAPIVVAAGAGYVAQQIVEIADEFGVAVYHDDSAATLLSRLELGTQIPPELYNIIAEIYVSLINAADKSKKAGG